MPDPHNILETEKSFSSTFRCAFSSGVLTEKPMHRVDAWRMVQRRAEKAGIDADMCCHTFRATGLANFLANGGTLENAQAMADHASPRTTQLYDRTRRRGHAR
jgi:site-specific recombinase XerD